MAYNVTNEVEESNRNRIARYARDDMLVKIYKALPEEKREQFLKYRELWLEVDKERLELSFPLNLYIELVSACNLKCSFCIRSRDSWKSTGNMFSKIHLGFENFKRIIDEGVQYSLPAIWVGASGEALLEKALCKMMRYAHEKGIVDCCLVTNGTLLNKSIIDQLVEIPITRINISIDAFTKETYKKVRGGNYGKLQDNIHYLLQKRESCNSSLPVVRVTFVDIPENRQEKDAFISYWIERVDTVDVQKYFDFDVNGTPDEKSRDISCSFPWRTLMIMSNGDVVPCCSFYGMRDLIIGNISQTTLKKTWDSPQMAALRNNMIAGNYTDSCKLCVDCRNN